MKKFRKDGKSDSGELGSHKSHHRFVLANVQPLNSWVPTLLLLLMNLNLKARDPVCCYIRPGAFFLIKLLPGWIWSLKPGPLSVYLLVSALGKQNSHNREFPRLRQVCKMCWAQLISVSPIICYILAIPVSSSWHGSSSWPNSPIITYQTTQFSHRFMQLSVSKPALFICIGLWNVSVPSVYWAISYIHVVES